MRVNKKSSVISVLVVVGTISVAAISRTPKPNNDYKNLQVLPKDISPKALQHIMVDEFQDGLGVGCNFCHAQEKGSLHLDYASDEKPEKQIARGMMCMAMDINNKYFEVEHPLLGDSLMTVSCFTCHHGVAHPDANQ